MKKFFSTLMLTALCGMSYAQQAVSPDGHLRVQVSCNDGKASYTVMLDNDVVIEDSPLGLKTSIGDFTKGLKLTEANPQAKQVSESYSLPNAKIQNISYTANEYTYSFTVSQPVRQRQRPGQQQNGQQPQMRDVPAFDVVMHIDNSNVAFKYVVYTQGDRKSCLVQEESTAYTFPTGTTTFLCPAMTPQTGFARTAPSYETFYEYDAEMGKNGHGRGYTFPAMFKVKAQAPAVAAKKGKKAATPTQQAIWVMLNETNIGGNYCGGRIENKGNQYHLAYPEPTEFGGIGNVEPGLMLDNRELASTPWRTITVGRDLKPLAETTIQWDLVKPQYEAKYDYKYGRSAWSWIIRMDASCNYDEQKEYVDFASAMGWEYLLVDALWDTNIGYERMEQLSKYAQSKGVNLFLWYNSNGYWNDAPQGPRGKMHRMIDRRKEMRWMQKAGIKGIKVDFVGSDKQQTMQMYEDILADANECGIMVIFHGCTLPRGWERMYPNFVACEAVRASENLAFGQNDNDIEALAATIHPVLRNAVGNMDFGGSALNKHYSKGNDRGTTRKTSDVYALATAILFQTPVQNFAVAPNNITDAPAWAIDFMKKVPVTWKDMKFISGYPGKYVELARQATDGKWYVAAVNAQDATMTVTYNLDGMFKPGQEVTVYCDDDQLQGSKKTLKTSKKNEITVTIPKNGGLVICE